MGSRPLAMLAMPSRVPPPGALLDVRNHGDVEAVGIGELAGWPFAAFERLGRRGGTRNTPAGTASGGSAQAAHVSGSLIVKPIMKTGNRSSESAGYGANRRVVIRITPLPPRMP